MEKKWYILRTATGQENKVCESISNRIRLERMEEYVGECRVPTERVKEMKGGKRRTFVKTFFPGYVFCELALYDESREVDDNGNKPLLERTWRFIRETPGVKGFVDGNTPRPMPEEEVLNVFSDKPAGRATERPKIDFAIDEIVKLKEGPFMGQVGKVSMVDPGKGKIKVDVNIFSRLVQFDAESWQVEKVSDQENRPAQ